MKIAVGTNDQTTINRKHFGESQYFAVFTVLNGEITRKEFRENPNKTEAGGEHGRTDVIIQFLNDCQIIIGQSMGHKALGILGSHPIDVIISEIDDIQLAVEAYLVGDDEKFRYFDASSGKIRSCLDRK
jgi:predicted Fe-Mo cluster-binding NifX family protein